jgi:RND family efflux transporter MFP subunit
MRSSLLCALGAALLLAGCGGGDSRPAAGAARELPPVSVTTVGVETRDFPVVLHTTGTVTPLSSVDVKAQVASVVTRVHVHEGQFVRAGELLFTLDARADQANLEKAQAQLARDLATLDDAKRQLARSRDLLAQGFIAQGAVDTAQAGVEAQQAAVQADRAAIAAEQVNLSYTRITAPGAGRIGAISVFPGSSVAPGGPALLSITQLDPIAVAFSLPQRHLGDALAALQGGGAAVAAALPGAAPRRGRLSFVDNAVDAGSGTIRVKAVFENRDARLWPGAYVDVSLTARTLAGAIVLPQATIVQTARGPQVFVVEHGKAHPRDVAVEYAEGADAAVTGLKPGERVVLDGRQNLRDGSAVVERHDAAGAASAPLPAQ